MASVQPLGIFGGAGGQAIAQELARRKEEDKGNPIVDTLTKLMEQQSLADYRNQLGGAQKATAAAALAKQGGLNTLADTLATQYPDDPSLPAAVRGGVLDGASYTTYLQSKQAEAGALQLFQPFADEYPEVGQLTPQQMSGLVQATGGDVKKIADSLEMSRGMYENKVFDDPVNQDAAIQITDKIGEMINPSSPWARVQLDVKKVKPEDLPALATKEVFNSELFKTAPQDLQTILTRRYAKQGVDGLNTLSETQWKRIQERDKLDMEAAKTQSTIAKDAAAIKLSGAKAAAEPVKAQAALTRANKPSGGGRGGKPKDTTKEVASLQTKYLEYEQQILEAGKQRNKKATTPSIQQQQQITADRIKSLGGTVPGGQKTGGGYADFVSKKFGL